MVAIFTGAGVGFERGSGSVVGNAGLLGGASHGRGGEQLFLNAATGNLMITQRDEILIGKGPDAAISRTYNSLGDLSDDNGDNWRQSTDRRIHGFVPGVSVNRVSADGTDVVYRWNGTAYVNGETGGAADRLSYDGSVWTWTDGSSQFTERYEAAGTNKWRITHLTDTDANSLTFTYDQVTGRLNKVQTADGGTVTYVWDHSNGRITSITTAYQTAQGTTATLTRTSYQYDAGNRLSQVKVDLTPEDGSTADGRSYSTIYEYHGATTRVAAVSQTDGSRVDFLYDTSGRVESFTQKVANGVARTTAIGYALGRTTITDASGQQTVLQYGADGALRAIVAPPAEPGQPPQTVNFGYEPQAVLANGSNTVVGIESVRKISGEGWGNQVAYGTDVLSGSGLLTFRTGASDTSQAVGLSTVADRANAGGGAWNGIPFAGALLFGLTGTVYTWTGSDWTLHSGVTNTAADEWAIAYSGTDIKYYKNGGLFHTQSGVAANQQLVFKHSAYSQNSVARDISLTALPALTDTVGGALTGVNWSQKPQSAQLGWGDHSVYSQQSVTGSSSLSFRVDDAVYGGKWQQVGLVRPQHAAMYGSDWTQGYFAAAIYFQGNTNSVSVIGANGWTDIPMTGTSSDVWTIDYDGASFRYLKNGIVFASTPTAAGLELMFKHRAASPGSTVRGIEHAAGGQRLTRVTDATGASTRFAYDAAGNVIATEDPLGNVVTRVYGAKNELRAETRYGSDGGAADAPQTTRYVYDVENHLRYVIKPDGEVTEYRYYADGSHFYTIDHQTHGYDVSGLNETSLIEESQLGRFASWRDGMVLLDRPVLTHQYDFRGNLTSISQANGVNQTNATTFTYDQAGQLLTRSQNGGATESFVYDGLGRVTASVDLNGGTTSILFRDTQAETVVLLASGLVQTSTYNRAGDLIARTESAEINYMSNGQLQTGTEGWTLHSAARVPSATGPAEFLFEATGGAAVVGSLQQIPEVDTLLVTYSAKPQVAGQQFHTWVYWYDGQYNQIAANVMDNFPQSTTQFATLQKQFTRPAGAVYMKIDTYAIQPSGAVPGSSAQWGAYKITTGSPPPDANLIAPSTAVSKYDTAGRLRVFTDAAGTTSYFVYDALGRKVADVSETGSLVEYRYDAANRVVGTIGYASKVTGANLAALASPTNTLTVAQLRPVPDSGRVDGWQIYDKAGRVTWRVDGSGGVATFEYDKSGQLVKTTGYAKRLTAAQVDGMRSGPAQPLLPASDQADSIARNFYDRNGRLVAVLDGSGTLSRTKYSRAGEVTERMSFAEPTDPALRASGTLQQLLSTLDASDGANRVARYVYDNFGQLRYELDALNRPTEYVYNHGLLRQTIVYAGSIAPSALTVAAVKAAVDASGLAGHEATRKSWSVVDAAGRVAYSIDAGSAVTRFVYDTNGQVVRTVRYAALRPTPALPSLQDMDNWAASEAANAENRVTRNYYDQKGQLRYSVDAEGYVSGAEYDAAGRVLLSKRWDLPIIVTDGSTRAQVAAAVAGAAATQIVHTYDEEGRLKQKADGEQNRTYYRYDALGRIDRMQVGDAEPSVTTYAYDGAGRVVSETIAAETAYAATTHREYDGLGNVLAIVDPLNLRTERTYDALGRMLTEKNAKNETVSFQYDAFGQTVKTTDALQRSSYFWYDGLGRTIATRDAENNVTETGYTVFNEVASVTRRYNKAAGPAALNAPPQVAANPARDAVTSYEYDRLGRLKKTIDAEAYALDTHYTTFGEVDKLVRGAAVTDFTYDRLGRLTGTTDAEAHAEAYKYDAHGNRIQVTNKLGGKTDYSYDRRGLLRFETLPTTSVRPNGDVQNGRTTNEYRYDERGNLTTKIEALGHLEARRTDYVYDRADRLVETRGAAFNAMRADHSGTDLVIPVERIVYDLAGRVIETVSAAGARTLFWYDAANRVTAELAMDRVAAGGQAMGTLTRRSYDAAGNVEQVRVFGRQVALPQLPGGAAPADPPAPASLDDPEAVVRETSYTYDNLNRLKTTSMAGVRTGSWSGGVYSSTVATVQSSVDYDSLGNVVRALDANGASTFSYYDRLGRKTAEVDRGGYLTAWTHDADGNVLTERRFATRWDAAPTTETVPAVPQDGANDRVTVFTYDLNGRRKTETRLGVVAYTIDGATGALASAAQSAIIAYEYNAAGQVDKKTEANGDVVDYDYDNGGRLVREMRASYLGHEGTDPIAPTLRYSYDGLGNLTLTRQGGAAEAPGDRFTRHQYDPAGRLASTTNAAGEVRTYSYDAGGNLSAESYVRRKSSGAGDVVNEAVLYTRDRAGRILTQTVAGGTPGAWQKGELVVSRYNAFGDVSERGVVSPVADTATAPLQEHFAYDKAGRLWRSNSGDGVWRYFVYDANGQQTLAIERSGGSGGGAEANIGNAIGKVTAGNVIGAGFGADHSATMTVYDKRGLAVRNVLPGRQLRAGEAAKTLFTTRTHNAFGEMTSETGGRGHDASGNVSANGDQPYTSYFKYNAMGRLIEKRNPVGVVTGENGAATLQRPTEDFFYDLSGRMIASEDANNNLTKRLLVAGTGHGGGEALVMREFHADGGVLKMHYDVFGDLRKTVDEIDRTTLMTYDAVGRLVKADRPGGLTDHYEYDQLGQRVRHWNTLLGSGNAERTDYDRQGRVVSSVAFGGDATTTDYAWDGSLATQGMGTFGGWTVTTTYANSRTSVAKSDVFGREVWKQDLGGNQYATTYDVAGRVATRSAAGDTQTFAWLIGGHLGSISSTAGASAAYGYDEAGNRLWEHTTRGGATIQNAVATYDALGRLTRFEELGSGNMPAATVDYLYDAAGNIRASLAEHRTFDKNGVVSTITTPQHNWYRYDAMNRLVTKGELNGQNQIVRGLRGVDHAYNAAGQRVTTTRTVVAWATYVNPDYTPPPPPPNEPDPLTPNDPELSPDPNGEPTFSSTYDAILREDYSFHANGAMATVRIAKSSYTDNQNGTFTVHDPAAVGTLQASFTNDAMGRLTQQVDYFGNGTTAAYDRTVGYNVKGQIDTETIVSLRGGETITTQTGHQYGSGAAYALGGAITSSTTTHKLQNGSNVFESSSSSTTDYVWFDGAVQSQVTVTVSGGVPASTTFGYDAWGTLVSSNIGGSKAHSVVFTNDLSGQAVRRDETWPDNDNDPSNNYGSPHEVWYRFAGKQLGHVGNNGTADTDYATSIMSRIATPTNGPFRGGGFFHGVHADFDLSGETITTFDQGSESGGYTVRGGDTLAGIALQLWGDTSLWYKLAEANGLTAASPLVEGQRLVLPAGVARSAHNASTLKPYDPSDIMGDLSPTATGASTARPPKKNGCGMFGKIMLVAIAVAVSVALPQASIFFKTIGGKILGGMIASAVSQGVGVATGIQDKFDWKGVAMAGVTAGVAAGLSQAGGFAAMGIKGSSFATQALQGAITDAAAQGIGVATGLQKKFDWAGVAAAGIGQAVSGRIGGSGHGAQFVRNSVDALAGAATRSVLTGTSFGDNIIAVLPSVIGRTIGQAVAQGLVTGVKKIGAGPSGKPLDAPQKVKSTKAADIVVASGTPNPEQAENESIVVQGQRVNEALPSGLTREDIETWNQHDVVNERLQLLEAEQSLQQDRARLSPRKLARREARIARMTERVANLNRIDTALQEGVIGRTMMLGKNRATAYQIRGPGYRFDTKQDAARDGIAMSFMIARITGDSYERGSRIDIGRDGKYTYFTLQTGTRAGRDFSINRETISKGTLTMRITTTENTRAYFHTHPNAVGMGEGDADFSTGDIASYKGPDRPGRGAPASAMRRGIDAFLGGNDGSFDMLTPQLRNGRVVGYTQVDLAGDGYFRVPETRSLPTDMRGEPE